MLFASTISPMICPGGGPKQGRHKKDRITIRRAETNFQTSHFVYAAGASRMTKEIHKKTETDGQMGAKKKRGQKQTKKKNVAQT